MKSKAWTEKVMQGVFFIAACTSVLAVALICIFLFANGIPAIRQIGFVKFITGDIWRPGNELFGIFPMIIGSIYVTAGAIIFGVPIGILTSVFMAMYCPKKIYRPLKAATELLAGIPSVVYGFFGMVIVVPIIRDFGRTLKMMGLVGKIRRWKRNPDYINCTWYDDPSNDHRDNRKCNACSTTTVL